MVQLATRYSKLPDEVVYAEECGWGYETRYAFNDSATAYVEKFERMQRATKTIKAKRPKSSKSTYDKEIPANDEATLLRYLGIDPEHVKARELLETAISPEAWAAFEDDGEWDSEPEPEPTRETALQTARTGDSL